MSPPSWTSFQPPTPSNPSRLSQSTGLSSLSHYSKVPLAICFTYGSIYVSMLLSQFIPSSSSPPVSKSLFSMAVSPPVQFSRLVVSDSLWPHGLQHSRLPRPSPTPGAFSNSCPSSQWCHPTISSSVIPFSSCLQSFPASGSFPRSQLFASGGQSTEVSASASVLPMNIQD